MSFGLEGQPVIGKMADLQDLGAGERELALPDQGNEAANLTKTFAGWSKKCLKGGRSRMRLR